MSNSYHKKKNGVVDVTSGTDSNSHINSLSTLSVKDFLAAIPMVFGLIYALGFFITNLFLLTKFNIYNFEIFKARYIYVGAIFSILLYVMYIFSIFAIEAPGKTKNKIGKTITFIVITFIGGTLPAFALQSMLMFMSVNFKIAATVFTMSQRWGLMTITLLMGAIFLLYKGEGSKAKLPYPIPYGIFTGLIFASILYGLLVYPILPISLGGGFPIPIQLIIKPDNTALVSQFIPEANFVTDKIYLIDQSQTSYFVLVNNEQDQEYLRPIELDKSLFAGTVHIVDKDSPIWLYRLLMK